jgi:hypothetical protein
MFKELSPNFCSELKTGEKLLWYAVFEILSDITCDDLKVRSKVRINFVRVLPLSG